MNLNCIGLVLFLCRRVLLNIHHDISHPALQCEICSYLFGSVSRTAPLVTSENLLTFPFCNGHHMIEVAALLLLRNERLSTLCELSRLPLGSLSFYLAALWYASLRIC